MNDTLFPEPDEPGATSSAPLAERMRPRRLDEIVGQSHLVGKGKVLREMIEHDRLMSIILWGPPGTGKTTLARIIARETRSNFVAYSAVLSGIKEIKAVMADAEAFFRRTSLGGDCYVTKRFELTLEERKKVLVTIQRMADILAHIGNERLSLLDRLASIARLSAV